MDVFSAKISRIILYPSKGYIGNKEKQISIKLYLIIICEYMHWYKYLKININITLAKIPKIYTISLWCFDRSEVSILQIPPNIETSIFIFLFPKIKEIKT